MDLEPHRPATLPLATGPVLIGIGILIHVLFAEWISHRSASILNHVWIGPVCNDLGSAALFLGCVLTGLQLLRIGRD